MLQDSMDRLARFTNSKFQHLKRIVYNDIALHDANNDEQKGSARVIFNEIKLLELFNDIPRGKKKLLSHF